MTIYNDNFSHPLAGIPDGAMIVFPDGTTYERADGAWRLDGRDHDDGVMIDCLTCHEGSTYKDAEGWEYTLEEGWSCPTCQSRRTV